MTIPPTQGHGPGAGKDSRPGVVAELWSACGRSQRGMIALGFASEHAWRDHVHIFEALRAHDPDRVAAEIRSHLTRILQQINRIRDANPHCFADENS